MTHPAQFSLFESWTVHERVSSRARRTRVDVRPDGSVVLTIPARGSRAAALRFLEQSREWIERTRRRLEKARSVFVPTAGPKRDIPELRETVLREGRRLLDGEAARLGVRYTRLSVRDARTRWGSCGPDGSIMLSARLALAPLEVLRYVVIHELCHLRWRGHGPRFWALVERQMPEFELHRRWLRRHGHELM